MKLLVLFIYYFIYISSTFAQDTISLKSREPIFLPAAPAMYVFVPANPRDSIAVVNSKIYLKLMQDKESCKTFMQLYQLYQKQVSDGDIKVQGLITGYEVIIKTKDSSYATLLQEYYRLNSITEHTFKENNETLLISRNSLDSLQQSLQYMTTENTALNHDLKQMKRKNVANKLTYGFIGIVSGLVIGILLTR